MQQWGAGRQGQHSHTAGGRHRCLLHAAANHWITSKRGLVLAPSPSLLLLLLLLGHLLVHRLQHRLQLRGLVHLVHHLGGGGWGGSRKRSMGRRRKTGQAAGRDGRHRVPTSVRETSSLPMPVGCHSPALHKTGLASWCARTWPASSSRLSVASSTLSGLSVVLSIVLLSTLTTSLMAWARGRGRGRGGWEGRGGGGGGHSKRSVAVLGRPLLRQLCGYAAAQLQQLMPPAHTRYKQPCMVGIHLSAQQAKPGPHLLQRQLILVVALQPGLACIAQFRMHRTVLQLLAAEPGPATSSVLLQAVHRWPEAPRCCCCVEASWALVGWFRTCSTLVAAWWLAPMAVAFHPP